MILQAESKREYEEVSVKEAVRTAVFDPTYCFTFPSQRHLLVQSKYQSYNNVGAVETYLCGFQIWFCAWMHLTGLSQLISIN